jgi:hypothetical protein
MSSRDRRDDDLEERLDELEEVLGELRADLRASERDRRGPPRPPSLSELVRFTEQYTIPTVIALLETTIKSLELLRGTLRLADPGRSVAEGAEGAGDRLADVRDGATAGLARSLSELRTALSEADLPEDAASRSIIADARDLTAEIESRIEESRREADAARGRRGADGTRDGGARDRRRADAAGDDGGGPVRIDVSEPGADDEPADADPGADAPADGEADAPAIDVESELESIKRQVDGDEAEPTDEADAGDEANAGDEAEPTHDAGAGDADGADPDDRED